MAQILKRTVGTVPAVGWFYASSLLFQKSFSSKPGIGPTIRVEKPLSLGYVFSQKVVFLIETLSGFSDPGVPGSTPHLVLIQEGGVAKAQAKFLPTHPPTQGKYEYLHSGYKAIKAHPLPLCFDSVWSRFLDPNLFSFFKKNPVTMK